MHKCGDCKRKGGRRATAIPGTSQVAGDSDAHRGREHIGGARIVGVSATSVSGWVKIGTLALERMRAMSAWRTSGRVSTIVASTIALDEMGTYLGARRKEKRNSM